jgi:hypothetical protein
MPDTSPIVKSVSRGYSLDRTDEWLERKANHRLALTPNNLQIAMINIGFCLTGWLLVVLSVLNLLHKYTVESGVRSGIVLLVAYCLFRVAGKRRLETVAVSDSERYDVPTGRIPRP